MFQTNTNYKLTMHKLSLNVIKWQSVAERDIIFAIESDFLKDEGLFDHFL